MKKNLELKEIRSKEMTVVSSEIAVLDKKLVELQFKTAFRRLKNFHEITQTRKRLARLWTILNEKAQEKVLAQIQEEVKNAK